MEIKEALLISFCNIPSIKELENRRYSSLGLLDYKESVVYWIKLPPTIGGITGLSQNEDCFFALYQGSPGGLLVFNKKGFDINQKIDLDKIRDPHSLLFDDNWLYIVSTGIDSILRYLYSHDRVDVATEEIIWRPRFSKKLVDSHHINGICKHKDTILISAFGLKRGERWSSAKKGYILNLKNNEKIVQNIFHPHSIVSDNGKIFFCESSTKTLKQKNRVVVEFKMGYTRGLAINGKFITIGLSSGRKISKSTGLINNIADPGELIPFCKVVFLHRKYLFLKGFWKKLYYKLAGFYFDFDKFHREIYDLLFLNNISLQKKYIIGEDKIIKRYDINKLIIR